ncbi:PREDICTED: WAT1-related protein At5g07050-like [Camelina sativa]|uniref:WAT1-related protein n=1 Tax=Camelina sativa TaxID=90675 RepID=A0ABM0Y409_CAMSA|nr:PREDICTED: WAT1-related protein At5g07050-like [Camelina sativa]
MSMEELSSCESFLTSSKPYFAMISLQFGYAGMNIITKISLNTGMSHYVLVVYRHAIATAVIAPFAFFFERKSQPKITYSIFMQLFILGLLGPVIDQNFYYMGLKYTSPTFSCAMSNMLPAMTFILAVLFRMEMLDVKKLWCQAKIGGTVVTVGGAMVMTLYKGPIVELFWTKYMHLQDNETASSKSSSDKDFLKGSILLILATLAWASLFVLQILKTYAKHQLSLTTLICFIGTIQAVAVTFVMEHNPSAWRIGWDMNLLAAAYSGIVASSISYYVQGIVMKKRGPVFATAFSPLMMVIVAVMGSFVLAENIFLGGVIGAVLIVIGLYAVLWGKQKENQVTICEPTKTDPNSKVNEDVEANGTEIKISEGDNSMLSTIVISVPLSETPLKKTIQAP